MALDKQLIMTISVVPTNTELVITELALEEQGQVPRASGHNIFIS